MNYTLYIDESGDFQSQKGQWIISGVLFPEKYEICEEILKKKFSTMPKELNLSSIRDFHMTEFRKNYGDNIAVEMAKNTLKKLDVLPFEYNFLTTINFSKTSLSNREKTYRLMLSDLLALCETVLADNIAIDKLDLVVATRTIDGVLQTNVGNIKEDIINSLPVAFEVDLATKGIIELIGKHINIRMDYANNSWGLVSADFIANLTYNNKKITERKYFEELENRNKYASFESFGDFESRKANVASRDGDYVIALYRWAKILAKDENNEYAKKSIQKNLHKLFNKKGTTGSYIAYEALIERFWRNHNSPSQYEVLALILNIFENQLLEHFEKNKMYEFEQYIFRLRNLMIIVQNHIGNTPYALKLAQKQHGSIAKLSTKPEYFDLVLNFKSIEIEIYVNNLDFKKALILANRYSDTINTYKEVWDLLADNPADEFENSRVYIKAEMIKFRAEILNNNIDKNFDYLEKFLSNKYDISRYKNYKTMLLLKQDKSKKAVDEYMDLIENNLTIQLGTFDIFWFIKAINESFLSDAYFDIEKYKKVVNKQILFYDLNTVGHPYDLLLRELALFEFNCNNKSLALKYIRKSKNSFNLENSNIAVWLQCLIYIHEDYFKNKLKSENEYFENIPDCDLISQMKEIKAPLFKKIRYISPY